MKRFIAQIIASIIVVYCLIAGISHELNIMNWTIGGKIISIVLLLTVIHSFHKEYLSKI
jgi:hypothetical protein